MNVLDNGYINLVEHWGSDERIIESARMSTNKGFNGWGDKDNPGDEKLLKFLYDNKHHTPFEMAGATIEVKAPIFVFREWHRHRTQSYNEMSARYIPLPDENYIPSIDRMLNCGQNNKNKQSGTESVSSSDANEWLAELASLYSHAQSVYESAVKRGIAKEVARLPVPVARYSRMRASANLRNWIGFLYLRQSESAQWEIRQYANCLYDILRDIFPRTMELYKS